MVEFNGLGHSAAIHTKDEALAKRFGTEIKAMRIIWNSPSTLVVSVMYTTPSFHH